MSKAITLTQLASAVASVVAFIKGVVSNQDEAIKGKANAAPKDGKKYVQENGEWVELPESQSVEYASDEEVEQAIDEIFKA